MVISKKPHAFDAHNILTPCPLHPFYHLYYEKVKIIF